MRIIAPVGYGSAMALSFPSRSHFCKVLVVRPMSLPNSLGEYMLSKHISYYISICLSTLFSPLVWHPRSGSDPGHPSSPDLCPRDRTKQEKFCSFATPLCVAGTLLPMSLLMKKWSVTHPTLQAELQCQTNDNGDRSPILQQPLYRRSATSA